MFEGAFLCSSLVCWAFFHEIAWSRNQYERLFIVHLIVGRENGSFTKGTIKGTIKGDISRKVKSFLPPFLCHLCPLVDLGLSFLHILFFLTWLLMIETLKLRGWILFVCRSWHVDFISKNSKAWEALNQDKHLQETSPNARPPNAFTNGASSLKPSPPIVGLNQHFFWKGIKSLIYAEQGSS